MLSEQEKHIRLKLRDDFPFYAENCLKIINKEGDFVHFKLNAAQKAVNEKLEQQKRENGKVRAIILKGRQMGISTYVQARYLHQVTHQKGKRAFILTHAASATQSLYGMTKRYYNNLPEEVKPTINKNNASELDFLHLDSGYRVSTAGSSGVGRGNTIHYLHSSEVAFQVNADEHITGLLQAVSDSKGTEIILESTSDGPKGVFYKMCQDALQGKNDFELIFLPWFMQPEYRMEVPANFVMSVEEKDYMEDNGIDLEQIAWRRNKINTFIRGIEDFRREYPANIEEAFKAEAENALWQRKDIEHVSRSQFESLLSVGLDIETCVAYDPAGTSNDNSDESGIIVATRIDDKVYIHDDISGKYKPDEVVHEIKNLYYRHDADRITAEVNYGGDFIQHIFRAEDPNMVVYTIHAHKGKRLRAEPVAHAYRQKRVYHVGDLSLLESEYTTWNPYDPKAKSPNRLDAAVYAITDLLSIGQPIDQPVAWAAF